MDGIVSEEVMQISVAVQGPVCTISKKFRLISIESIPGSPDGKRLHHMVQDVEYKETRPLELKNVRPLP